MKLARSALAALTLAVGACASAPLPEPSIHHSLGKSALAWVEPFDMEHTEWIGDHGKRTKEAVRDRLAAALADRLRIAGFDASVVNVAPESKEGLVFRGTIDLVDAGDRSARAIWGKGAGHPEFRCTAQIVNLAVSSTEPAAVVTVSGDEDERGMLDHAGYPSLADASAAAVKIVRFVTEHRR